MISLSPFSLHKLLSWHRCNQDCMLLANKEVLCWCWVCQLQLIDSLHQVILCGKELACVLQDTHSTSALYLLDARSIPSYPVMTKKGSPDIAKSLGDQNHPRWEWLWQCNFQKRKKIMGKELVPTKMSDTADGRAIEQCHSERGSWTRNISIMLEMQTLIQTLCIIMYQNLQRWHPGICGWKSLPSASNECSSLGSTDQGDAIITKPVVKSTWLWLEGKSRAAKSKLQYTWWTENH